MEGSFPASSLHPPAVAPATTRCAPWVLLDSRAYFAVCKNATTAEATTSTGHMVKVSFCLSDPPAISHFCVFGPELKHEDFMMEPLVLFSAKDLVLLRLAFTVGPRSTHKDSRLAEYFLYKAGRGKPSLEPIPVTPPGTRNSFHICVLPSDDDDGEFVIADLCMTNPRSDYELHVFSSKTGKWTTKQLRLQASPVVKKEDLPGPSLDKVIALGGGAVGWIDLWRGIISCNVFDKNPVLSFTPVPMLEENERHEGNPRLFRDITCSNGVIKFVELDLRFKKVAVHNIKTRKTTKDLDSVDIIHDSELLFHKDDSCTDPVEYTLVDDGWKLRTCYRHTSWDYWRKGHTVDIDDILADNTDHSMLLPQLWDAKAGKSTLRNLYSAYPTLGIDGGNIVYLMSKVVYNDENAWMIGVDLEKKAVEVLVPVSSERVCLFKPDFLPCTFSKYLDATPRSCAEEVIPTANVVQKSLLNDHVSSGNFSLNKLSPLQDTRQCYGGSTEYAGPYAGYRNYQQHLTAGTQPLLQVLNTDPFGQLWLSLRLDDHLLSQLTGRGPAPPPFTPFPTEEYISDENHVFSGSTET